MNDFSDIVNKFTRKPDKDTMSRLIVRIESHPPSDKDIAYLASQLSESGKKFKKFYDVHTADIPSTGGPSSLSTILCPLYLRALGYVVPKLGIPGRPAGGIDVLAQIQGYKIDFTYEEVERLLEDSGYVHFLAANLFAPLDAIFFSYRKEIGKINVPELAIASLLSKKKAAAVPLVGLDVRVAPHGNFGASFDIASRNSERFCNVSQLLGIKSKCFLTDASVPYQPYIGRGEALVAVYNILCGQAGPWLGRHDDVCYAMANRLIQADRNDKTISRPAIDDLHYVFSNNLDIQGSSFTHFESYVDKIQNEHTTQIKAATNGFIHINLDSLRSLMVRIQNRFVKPDLRFPDPCGIILNLSSGQYAFKGDILATIRCIDEYSEEFTKGVTNSINVSEEPIIGKHFTEVSHG
jgi:pyrimidine-nucleoside phosphorylase